MDAAAALQDAPAAAAPPACPMAAEGQAATYDAAAALQVATCAEVIATLPACASADEAAALCARLADLLEEHQACVLDSDAVEGLMRVLSASQREHAAHAGLQEAVFQIWDWIYDALLKTTQQRDAMYKLLLSAAHTHIGVAGVQCRVWEWIAFFEDFYDIEEECPPLDETSVSAFRARDAARTRLAFSLLVSALYFHMANAQVVQSCLKCMRFFTNDNLIMDASDAIFEAYRTHGRDADSLSGVWSALSSLVFCCTFDGEPTPENTSLSSLPFMRQSWRR